MKSSREPRLTGGWGSLLPHTRKGVTVGRPLTSPEREEKGALAYEMSLLGKSQRKISQEIGVHHSTVASLLREQIQHRRKERKDSVHSLLDGFDAAIGECWERLSSIPKNSASPAAPQLISGINNLIRSKLDVLGFKAPSKSQSWVHHSKDQARLEKLSEEELEEYIKLLERLFPDDDSDAEVANSPERQQTAV